MAARMAGVGRVTVSLRRSTLPLIGSVESRTTEKITQPIAPARRFFFTSETQRIIFAAISAMRGSILGQLP
jgi:hypothetical protein